LITSLLKKASKILFPFFKRDFLKVNSSRLEFSVV
jgi:hypothetical protein